jgi:tRNA threonylcarbamoyladenosine biosynthesis protein TsaB
MKILGINTATMEMGIALIEDDKVIHSKHVSGPTAKAEQLIPWIKEMLETENVQLAELDCISVAKGPGAFTGLRIGVVTAKTLSQMLEKPLAGVSTLEAFARQVKDSQSGKKLRVILNACRGDLNTALFEVSGEKLVRLEEDHAEKKEELMVKIENEESLILSDIKDIMTERQLDEVPDGAGVALLAVERMSRDQLDDPIIMPPVYSHGPNIRISPKIHKNLAVK